MAFVYGGCRGWGIMVGRGRLPAANWGAVGRLNRFGLVGKLQH